MNANRRRGSRDAGTAAIENACAAAPSLAEDVNQMGPSLAATHLRCTTPAYDNTGPQHARAGCSTMRVVTQVCMGGVGAEHLLYRGHTHHTQKPKKTHGQVPYLLSYRRTY